MSEGKEKQEQMTNQFRKIHHSTIIVEDTLGDDEATGQRSSTLLAVLLHAHEDFFEAAEVIVVEPPDG